MPLKKASDQQRILVVDDAPTNIKMLVTILGSEHAISIATNGKDALEIAQLNPPDLILLDVMMPEMDGYEACRQLKNNPTTQHIPIIFITAKDTKSDETKGLEMGAIDYIRKPYNPSIVQARIHNHLRRGYAERAIKRLHQQNQMILATAGEGIYGVDTQGVITFVNPAASAMLGWTSEEMIGNVAHTLMHHSYCNKTPYPIHKSPIHATLHNGLVHQTKKGVFWHKNGTCLPVEYVSTPIQNANTTQKEIQGAVVVFRDISHQKKMETKDLNSQISRIAISALLETSLEPLSLKQQLDVALRIILSVSWLSIEFKGSIFLVDHNSDTLILATHIGFPDILLEKCQRIPFGYCLCGRAAHTKKLVFCNALSDQHDITFEDIHQHGHYCVPILWQNKLMGVLNLYVPHNHPQNLEEDAFVVTIANTLAGIIARRKLEKQLEHSRKKLFHLARHDKLTGLPNRMLFNERLQQSLIRARRDRTMMALMFIDLDRFKYVNDTFGHETGDQLLVYVANCIQNALREADTVARMGGDEFTAIISTIIHEEDAILVAKKIVNQLKQPITIQQCTCNIGVSIGISIFPLHAETSEALLKRADVAMYCVKERGRNNYLVYKNGIEKQCPDLNNSD